MIPYSMFKKPINKSVFRIRSRIIHGFRTNLGLPDPDPLVRGTDPSIRIRIKMSRIQNIERKMS